MIAVSGMMWFFLEEDPVCAWPSHNRSSDEAVYDIEERPSGSRGCGEGGDEPGGVTRGLEIRIGRGAWGL